MITPLPAALMLPGAGRYPFNGIFELNVAKKGCCLQGVGRIAASSPPEKTWGIVVRVYEALQGIDGQDRLELLRATWDRVLTLPRQDLGPAQGKDLSLLLVAWDDDGTSAAGVGLQLVWRWTPESLKPLVQPGHPLLAPAGIPRLPPGELTLHDRPTGPLVAAPTGPDLPLELAPQEILHQCGVRA